MLSREQAIIQLQDAIASMGKNDAERTRLLYARYAIEIDRTTLRKWRQGKIPNSAIIAAILITEYHEV